MFSDMRRPLFRAWIISWFMSTLLFFYPINTGPIRIGLILSVLILVAGSLYFGWDRKVVRYGLVALLLAVAIFLNYPGRSFSSEQLRQCYVASLRSYEGTKYIWGGEGKLGIDCSGLVRAGLIRANCSQGILTLNPKLVREAISLWWHDASAQMLGLEYRCQTRLLSSAPDINRLESTNCLPGDIAVTTSGVHVLACLNSNEWIEADPDLKKVIIVHVPEEKNPWFHEPVHILRWTELETK
jgi:hypothetical protein